MRIRALAMGTRRRNTGPMSPDACVLERSNNTNGLTVTGRHEWGRVDDGKSGILRIGVRPHRSLGQFTKRRFVGR